LGAFRSDGGEYNVILGSASSAESSNVVEGTRTFVGAVFEVRGFPAASFRGALMPGLSSIGTKAAKYATRESRDFVLKS